MKQRDVGMELLRIIAMLMVLGLHANFLALPAITSENVFTVEGLSRSVIQSLCIVAVNVFVMISGWFGIRPTLRGFCNFMWQVLFIVGFSYLAGALFCDYSLVPKDFFRSFGLYYGGGWFVASYIGLYIISPILNSYVENTSVNNIAIMLGAFFAFEFIWGNTLSVDFVVGGYSTFSFIGVYIFAGMLRKVKIKWSKSCICGVFIFSTLLNALLFIVAVRLNIIVMRDILFNYINPLVVVSAAAFLLLFTPPVSLHNTMCQRVMLWCASSCFAAYLIHAGTEITLTYYVEGARWIYEKSGNLSLLTELLYIVIVFMFAVIIDQPRKLVWRKLLLPIFDKNA